MNNKYIDQLAYILENEIIENEDLIAKFIEESKTDYNKEMAIERFFVNAPSSNPFNDGLGYYDLIHHYEDIMDENA